MNKYRVWISQINQTYIDVKAYNSNEAIRKAYRKWHMEVHPDILSIKKIEIEVKK
jgi:DnaJ-class molecular chaperone